MPASNVQLAEKFHRQALSDLQVYDCVSAAGFPACHALHYLQMATEKISKAFELNAGAEADEVQKSHAGFAKLVEHLRISQKFREALHLKTDGDFKRRIKSFLPLAQQIERLAPAEAKGEPNPEYPFKVGARGEVVAPAEHHFELIEDLSGTPPGLELMKVIDILIRDFEEIA